MSGTLDERGEKDVQDPAQAVAYLVLGMECDRPFAGSGRYSLERIGCVLLGRGAGRGVTRREDEGRGLLDVRVPSPAMSSEHARIVRVKNEWVLEDLGSTNGTFVNGLRVERAVLGARDVITVGRTLFFLLPPRLSAPAANLDMGQMGAGDSDGFVSLDPELQDRLDALRRIARSEIPVLIRGETGTGKELLARAIHQSSGRSGPFLAVNCGGIPSNLVESHFFGHVKGAFSGAGQSEAGAFRTADGGTLFLDEIGDLLESSQAALLRALQEREVVPVGAVRPVKVDVRVVAATHQPLERMAAKGTFRHDLLARLAGFTAELRPLRERQADLGSLVASLLTKLARGRTKDLRFTSAAGEALFRHAWPLNVRELEQCLASALVLAAGEVIDVGHLPAPVTTAPALAAPPEPATPDALVGLSARDARIRLELLEQLARHGGNLAEVGRVMGKARMQVHRWCRRFGIDPNMYRG